MSETSPLDDFISSGALSLQTGPFGSQLHSYDYVEEGVPVIPTEGIQEGRIDHSVLPKITDDKSSELARHAVIEDDILFARRGAQATGRSALIRRSEVGFICGTGAIRARVNDRTVLDPNFLAWFLATPSTVTWIREQAIGATMPNLNKSIIGRIEVPLLPVEEQREIAAVLGALDDKIELNRKTAATLEAMARALYRSWFVDFDPVHAKAAGRPPAHMDTPTAALFPDHFGDDGLPEGWLRHETCELVSFTKGRSYKSKELQSSSTALISLKSFQRGGGYRSDGLKAYTGVFKPEQVVRPGEIVISLTDVTQAAELIGRATFARSSRDFETLVASLDVGILRALNANRTPQEFLHQVFNSNEFLAHALAHTSGTTVLHLAKEAIPSFPMLVPDQPIVGAFDRLVRPMRENVFRLEDENQTLAQLRDTLLPRLMSGTLRVPTAREQVEDIA